MHGPAISRADSFGGSGGRERQHQYRGRVTKPEVLRMVAGVMMVTRPARVTCVKSPEPMVLTPAWINARGVDRSYSPSPARMVTLDSRLCFFSLYRNASRPMRSSRAAWD